MLVLGNRHAPPGQGGRRRGSAPAVEAAGPALAVVARRPVPRFRARFRFARHRHALSTTSAVARGPNTALIATATVFVFGGASGSKPGTLVAVGISFVQGGSLLVVKVATVAVTLTGPRPSDALVVTKGPAGSRPRGIAYTYRGQRQRVSMEGET